MAPSARSAASSLLSCASCTPTATWERSQTRGPRSPTSGPSLSGPALASPLIGGGLVAAQVLHFGLGGAHLLVAIPAILLGGLIAIASDWR